MQTTSLSLLDRLVQNSEDTDWQKMISIYRPFIETVVRGYPTLRSHADDIAQEVMLVLMRELPVFQRQRRGSFRLWLRNITVNQLRVALRKSSREKTSLTSDSETIRMIDLLADPSSSLAKKWDEEHDYAVFQKVTELTKPNFNETTWQAFERYALNNEDPAKVGVELGISKNSVLLAKSRVINRMREEARGLIDA